MIKVFEAFAGYGSQRMALRNLGIDFEVVGISEIVEDVLLSYAAIHTDFLTKRENIDNFVHETKEEMIAELEKLNVPLDYKTFENRARKMKDSKLKEFFLANRLIHNYGDITKIDHSGKVIWDTVPDKGTPGSANIWNDSLVYVSSTDQFFKVDLKTGKEEIIKSNDVLKTYQYGAQVCLDGKILKNDGHDIKQYTLEDNTESVVLDFNYSDCNMYYLSCGNFQYADNKRAVFKDLRSSRNETPGRCKLTILEKTDKNPYAGKKVLEIAPIWGINTLMGETQQEFNRNIFSRFLPIVIVLFTETGAYIARP